jgi:hypothetical protein
MAFLEDEDDVPVSFAARKNYEDEDTTPTTDREIKGWYGYTIAAEVYAVVAVGKYNTSHPKHLHTYPSQEPSCPYSSNNLREPMGLSSLITANHVSLPEVRGNAKKRLEGIQNNAWSCF